MTSTLLTVGQWAELPESGPKTELVRGEIVEVAGGTLTHNWTRDHIYSMIDTYLAANRLGLVLLEQAFRITSDSGRIPDAAFATFERFGSLDPNWRVIPFVPNLCVEVISPSESAIELHNKIQEYLENGADTVWAIYTGRREAEIWERGARGCIIADRLTASCLPGLDIPLSAVIESWPNPNPTAA